MPYSLIIIWHERLRYLPAIMAVAFSALLIVSLAGLLVGLLSLMSIPVDRTRADIWVGNHNVLSVDLGQPIPESWLYRVRSQPEVERVEPCVLRYASWRSLRTGQVEQCTVMGSRLRPGALGAVDHLKPEHRVLLAEPGTVVVDESEMDRLGVQGVGDHAEIFGRRVRVVGVVRDLKSLGGPYVLCSLDTARSVVGLRPDQITYVLARCRSAADAPAVVDRLRHRYHDNDKLQQTDKMSAFTRSDFSWHSQQHWLTKVRAGMALGFAAGLGLLVGAVVTGQTLYGATAASLPQYMVLWALGISRLRIASIVVIITFWVALAGIILALPLSLLVREVAYVMGMTLDLPAWLLVGAAGITVVMAQLSGITALRLVWQANLHEAPR